MCTKTIYKKINKRKYLALLFVAVFSLLVVLVDISTGPAGLSIVEVFKTIILPNQSDSKTHIIVWLLRLPTTLMALIVGASLSVAGAEMQTILNNPLASPYTLGVSAGAGFGAALALVIGVDLVPHTETMIVPFNAFVFSLLTCILIFLVSKLRGVSAETMVLTGIALLFLFSSLLALLQYLASEEELQAIIFWLFGSLLKANWTKLGIAFGVFTVVIPFLLKDAWKLTALRLGDEKARSLGINVEGLRLKVFVLISVLAAASVCFVGTIGFIGLVGPHIARILVGEDQRFFIPMSALTGAFLLSTASVGSKLVVPGAVFPIGIVTSFIGVPFFLSLILMKRRNFW